MGVLVFPQRKNFETSSLLDLVKENKHTFFQLRMSTFKDYHAEPRLSTKNIAFLR